jgi:hypothetical protein
MEWNGMEWNGMEWNEVEPNAELRVAGAVRCGVEPRGEGAA